MTDDDVIEIDQDIVQDIQTSVVYDPLDDVMDIINQQDTDWLNVAITG